MTQNQGPWPGRFVWHDLMTTDAAKSRDFYATLFDWQIQEVPMPGGFTYHMILCGPGPIGGIVEEKKIPMSHWMPYLGVDDVDAKAKQITELGGAVCVPPTDIPQTGRFAVVNDPTGAYFSIYKGLPESQGFDPDLPVPGRACWNEVYTTDVDKAQAFYTAAFGWQPIVKDIGEAGTYNVQMLGDKQAGGMMKVPMPGMPSCWAVYFFVTDLDASGDKAKKLGATPMHENIPIPQIGRFSMYSDPVGAMFMLFEPDMNSDKTNC
ncbi:MAG: VOC family protein [Planctomycetes bacterium]|nr:VOC family protein [Planctomycetota bacterium]